MASSYSQNLLLIEPTPGDPSVTNSWGTLLNTNAALIDSAVAGILTLSVAGNSDVILTSVQGGADQSRNAHFVFTGALTGNIKVLWPQSRNRMFSVFNNTSGAFTLSVGANNGSGSPAGTTVSVPQGQTMELVSDGTNVSQRISTILSPSFVSPAISGATLSGTTTNGGTISGGNIAGASIDNSPIGATTASTAKVTTLDASGAVTFHSGGTFTGTYNGGTFSGPTLAGASLSGTTANAGTISGGTISSATISGGTIDNAPIGNTTKSSGKFTTLSASSQTTLGTISQLVASQAVLSVENPSGTAAQFMTEGTNSASLNSRVDNVSNNLIGFLFGSNPIGSINTASGTGVSYNSASDYRLKENVAPLAGALDIVARLKPSRFNFKADPAKTTVTGFIAHELQAVLPEAVTGEKDAVNDDGSIRAQGVDYGKLTPLHTACIQEMKALIDAQAAQIAAQAARIAALEAKLA